MPPFPSLWTCTTSGKYTVAHGGGRSVSVSGGRQALPEYSLKGVTCAPFGRPLNLSCGPFPQYGVLLCGILWARPPVATLTEGLHVIYLARVLGVPP